MHSDDDEDVIEAIAPHTIRFPRIEYNGGSFESITLQPLTIGLILDARKKGDELQQTLHMIQVSAGIPPQVAHKLLPQVIAKAGEYFGRFLPSDPKPDGAAPPPA